MVVHLPFCTCVTYFFEGRTSNCERRTRRSRRHGRPTSTSRTKLFCPSSLEHARPNPCCCARASRPRVSHSLMPYAAQQRHHRIVPVRERDTHTHKPPHPPRFTRWVPPVRTLGLPQPRYDCTYPGTYPGTPGSALLRLLLVPSSATPLVVVVRPRACPLHAVGAKAQATEQVAAAAEVPPRPSARGREEGPAHEERGEHCDAEHES